VLQGWLIGSLFAVVRQKGVNNEMEVNDQLEQSGSDDENIIMARKLMIIYSQRLFTGNWFIFERMSLNSGETFAHCLCLIFNELELHKKIAR